MTTEQCRPTKSESSVLPLVLTYHPNLPKVRAIVNKLWPINEPSSTLNEIFIEQPIMAYRRPKNLRGLLVRNKLKPDMNEDEPLGETRPCCKARCKICTMTSTQIAKIASGGEGGGGAGGGGYHQAKVQH